MTTPKAPAAHPLGAADGSAPEYRIEKVQDFLKVPEDRLEECLTEFRHYLQIARSVSEMVKLVGEVVGAKEAESEIGCFNWCDDGIRKGTLRLETRVEQNDKCSHGAAPLAATPGSAFCPICRENLKPADRSICHECEQELNANQECDE